MFISRIFTGLFLGGALTLTACSSANTGEGSTTNSAAQKSGPAATANGNATGRAQTAGGLQAADDADVVRVGSPKEVQIRAGGETEAEVRLDIKEGYHVNANPPTDKNLIGTALTVAGGEGLTAGAPVYPRAVMKKFEFDERPLAVYEREAVIKFPLRAAPSAARGQQTLPAKVRVQPCNDQACFPPRTIETTIPVTIN